MIVSWSISVPVRKRRVLLLRGKVHKKKSAGFVEHKHEGLVEDFRSLQNVFPN